MQGLSLVAKTFLTSSVCRREGFLRFKGCLSKSLIHSPSIPKVCKVAPLIQFLGWVIPLSQLLALWGNKNWPPSIKVKKLEILGRKMGLNGCKYSSLVAPSMQSCPSHSILELGDSSFPIISPLG